MTRKECLDRAAECVLKDRASQYGGMEDNFRVIANFWSIYLGRKVYPADVAAMMALLKIARLRANPHHADSWVDLAGYAACGAECAGGKPVFAPKADEGPKFKHGDKVQYRVELPSVSDRLWVDATYLRRAFDWQQGGHIVTDKKLGPVTVKDEDIRPAPKAEGCESLVEHDAPQTKNDLIRHIVNVNPAIYPNVDPDRLRSHTPTGEELAEMAQEDAHG